MPESVTTPDPNTNVRYFSLSFVAVYSNSQFLAKLLILVQPNQVNGFKYQMDTSLV